METGRFDTTPTPRWRHRLIRLLAPALLIATACGGSASGDDLATTLPLAADPCVAPADHAVGGEPVEYTFEVNDRARPVGVRVSNAAALEPNTTVVVILHPPGGGWESSAGLADLIGGRLRPDGAYIAMAPQASADPPVAWTPDESFNVEYLTSLFAVLERTFCLEGAEVVLGGRGEAAIAVAQAVCSTDLPIDAAYFQLGLVTIDGCAPPRPVPILSLGRYGAETPVGPNWDSTWMPPSTVEAEITGGFGPDADELAEWGEIYGCAGEPSEETLPDPEEALDRDTVVLAFATCDTPLIAFGMENDPGDFGVNPDALAAATDHIFEAFDIVLGR